MRTALLIFLINVVAHQQNCYNNASLMRFTNVICIESNPLEVKVELCRLKVLKRNQIAVNLNVTLIKPMPHIRARFQILKKANGFKPWLLDTSIDACQFLRKPNNPWISIIYKVFKNSSNINHTCPYSGSVIITDLYLTPKVLSKLPWPGGEYCLHIEWSSQNGIFLVTKYFFEYVEDL